MSYLNLANFYKSISKDKFLLFALLAGLVLRGLNPTFGSPSLYVSNDEAIAHLSAFNMIANKTPISIANYTPLGAYVQIPFLAASFLLMKIFGLVGSVPDFELFILTHEGYFLFIPRLISALFGTLTTLVIYKMTLLLFHLRGVKAHLGGVSRARNTAIIAAFLTTVSFNLVHISHLGRPWAAALFFFALGIHLTIKNQRFLSPVAVAFSYGFHQVGLLAFPLIALKTFRRKSHGLLYGFLISAFLILLFSLLTKKKDIVGAIESNQSLLLANRFLTDLIAGKGHLWESFLRTLSENLSVYFIINFLTTDAVIFLFGTAGLVIYFFKNGDHKEIFYYVIGYFIFAALFFHPLIRYLFPVFLLLIPFAAYSIVLAVDKKKHLLVFLIFLASVNSLWWNFLFLKKPTFILAHEWINKNVNKEIPIAYIGGRHQTFVPSREAIIHHQSANKNLYRRLLTILPEGNFDNVRNIIYVSSFPGRTKFEQLTRATVSYPVEYAVDYYLDPADSVFESKPEVFEKVVTFNPTRSKKQATVAEPLFDASWNFAMNNFKPKLSMYEMSSIGPHVDILKIRTDLLTFNK